MTYEFLVPKKGWTEEKFKKFLKHGTNSKLSEIIVRGQKNLLFKFFYGITYNTKGTAPLSHVNNIVGKMRVLELSPGLRRIPRYKYKSLIESNLYYQFYYNSYELDCMREKSQHSNIKVIMDGLEGNLSELNGIFVHGVD